MKKYPKLKKYPDGGKANNTSTYNPSFDYDTYYKDLNQFKTIPLNKKTGMIDTPKSLNPYLPTLSSNLKAQQATMDAYMQANKLKSLTPEQANEALSKANMGNYNYLKNAKAWEDYRNKTIVPGQQLDQTVDVSGTYNPVMGGGINMTPTTPYDSTHSQRMFPKNTVTNIQPHKYGGKQLAKFDDGGEYNPADPNRGKNTGTYIDYGMDAMNTFGQVQATNADTTLNSEQKAEAQSASLNQGADAIAGKALPWYGMAMGASNIGRGMIKKDANGAPANSNARATDALMKPIHQQQIDAATSGNWMDFAGSTLGAGFYAPIKAKLDKNYQYANGGKSMNPNAEVEKQEMMRMPNGSTEQVDGPSHENGGIPVNIPTGTEIFSDRLKNPITKMTFAKEAAKYKIKEGEKLSATDQLKNSIRQKKLDQIFQAQESLKQMKVQKYAEKMGVTLPQEEQKFPNGGTKLPQYGGEPPYETDGRFVPEGWETKSINGMSPMIESNDPSMKPFSDLSESSSMMNEYRESNPELYDNKLPMDEKKREMNSKQYPNLRDNLGLAGNTLLQNAGNITDLYMTKFGKKYDKENSGQLTSRQLDPTQALIDADIQNRITRGALAGAAGGNAGSYLSGAIQAGATNTLNKARIRADYDAKNTGITNQDLYHNQATRIQDKINEQQNKARSEDIARMAVKGISQNTAGAIADYKRGKMDQYTLDIISKSYPDYEYDSKKRIWKHKKTGAKLEVTSK